MFEVINDDCLTALKGWAASTIDSIITDPPYGISFMGKHWDYDVPGVEVWKECLRVLKPGGHILVACGTRTQHRMAVNIEDAGFEIRDLIAWVYGSGFPKSLNVGKAVDKMMGNEREVVGSKDLKRGSPIGDQSRAEMKLTGWNSPGYPSVVEVSKCTSEFEGWGTALKPAMELWTLARKPLTGTVAENVLEWGTGGLNIDGCRVEFKNEADKIESVTKNQHADFNSHNGIRVPTKGIYHGDNRPPENYNPATGRFPANFIHDGSQMVLDLFPESKSVGHFNSKINMKGHTLYEGGFNDFEQEDRTLNDSGSAARFFYCAKASKRERDAGLNGFDERKGGAQYRPNDDGENGIQSRLHGATVKGRNNHPTVKPISLMRYLCRLVTPKGRTVLDPFTGSGSTGCGAVLEGFNFIGIEREPEYVEIARARITNYIKQNDISL